VNYGPLRQKTEGFRSFCTVWHNGRTVTSGPHRLVRRTRGAETDDYRVEGGSLDGVQIKLPAESLFDGTESPVIYIVLSIPEESYENTPTQKSPKTNNPDAVIKTFRKTRSEVRYRPATPAEIIDLLFDENELPASLELPLNERNG